MVCSEGLGIRMMHNTHSGLGSWGNAEHPGSQVHLQVALWGVRWIFVERERAGFRVHFLRGFGCNICSLALRARRWGLAV